MKSSRFLNARVWTIIVVAALLVGWGSGWNTTDVSGVAVAQQTMVAQNTVATSPAQLDEQSAAFALQHQIISVYERVSPAVVNITSSTTVASAFGGAIPQEGTGSGFVYDSQGHIVTNYHVVEGANKVTVTFGDGTIYDATIVGTDPINDLAVVEIKAGAGLPAALELTDSDSLKIGQFVLAIGNPFRLNQTLTTGVVSALGRVIDSPQGNRFIGEAIQTDAAINPGNSGGPMLDLNGRVIGVNSQIISPSGANAGIGFAVSANTVARVVPELIASGSYQHPWLGVQLLPLDSSGAASLRSAGVQLPVDEGLLVVQVVKDSPADKAGLSAGSRYVQVNGTDVPVDSDIVTAINGNPARTFEELTVYLETETRVGDTVQLTVMRNSRELVIPVTLGELPAE